MIKIDIDLSQAESRILSNIISSKDPHTMHAVEMFGVSESEVTSHMRDVAKKDNYVKMYSSNRRPK